MLLNTAGSQIPIIKTVRPFTYNGQPALLETFVDITEQQKLADAYEVPGFLTVFYGYEWSLLHRNNFV